MESDNGGLEGEKAEGASIGSRRSSKSPSPYGKRADSEEDEDEASSSEVRLWHLSACPSTCQLKNLSLSRRAISDYLTVYAAPTSMPLTMFSSF
eukprot:scaffold170116_cov17-Tisochrysis_lutea.AAC.1